MSRYTLVPLDGRSTEALAAAEREKTKRQENIIGVVVGVGLPLGLAYWFYRQLSK